MRTLLFMSQVATTPLGGLLVWWRTGLRREWWAYDAPPAWAFCVQLHAGLQLLMYKYRCVAIGEHNLRTSPRLWLLCHWLPEQMARSGGQALRIVGTAS
jgi:hypothetical protein